MAAIVGVSVGVVIRVADMFFRMGLRGNNRDERNGPPIFGIISIVFLILAPVLAQLVRFAISRKREFLADASGALLTRYPEGLARALEKISSSPERLKRASNATAHLYIINPLKGKEPRNQLSKLLSTHPSIDERVKDLRDMKI